MTDFEWSKSICRIDGNAYRRWLEKYTRLTPAEIADRVGETGPEPNREALERISKGRF